MSTDTYIDFHSLESWQLRQAVYDDKNWKLDYGQAAHQAWCQLIDGGPTRDFHYCPERIAYVYNLFMDCNDDLWSEFTENFNGKLITFDVINDLVSRWTVLYDNAHDPNLHKGANDFCRADMVSPEEMRQILVEYGDNKVIYFRVD